MTNPIKQFLQVHHNILTGGHQTSLTLRNSLTCLYKWLLSRLAGLKAFLTTAISAVRGAVSIALESFLIAGNAVGTNG
jgi:hypothetical protein